MERRGKCLRNLPLVTWLEITYINWYYFNETKKRNDRNVTDMFMKHFPFLLKTQTVPLYGINFGLSDKIQDSKLS